MKKTYLINDLVWIGFSAMVCWGGLKLGFGSFHQPHAGFMPFLSGLVLGLLALVDLISGLINQWQYEKEDQHIWANINWGKLFLTIAVLFLYTTLFSTLGFMIGTIPPPSLPLPGDGAKAVVAGNDCLDYHHRAILFGIQGWVGQPAAPGISRVLETGECFGIT